MSRLASLAAVAALGLNAVSAHAQPVESPPLATAEPAAPLAAETAPPVTPLTTLPPADQGVGVAVLAAPDGFTTPGRDTGLPQTLWRGTPQALAQSVLPLLATKPLSPAAAALARRVLAAGAPGPDVASGQDAAQGSGDLAGARIAALLALGDVAAADAILQRASGIERNSSLSRAVAESALLAGDDARACSVADALGVGRDDIYWLRLRAYCQAFAGQAGAAQLTFDLAQAKAKDAVFARLLGAKLNGTPPGVASLRNGLDYALSRSLGLDLGVAKPSPAVAAVLAGGAPVAEPQAGPIAADLQPFADALGGSGSATGGMRPFARTTDVRMEAARMLAEAVLNTGVSGLGDVESGVPEGKATLGLHRALQVSANQKLMGAAALVTLRISSDAGSAGPSIGDRIRIVGALHAVGLEIDARNFALEGLASLK